MIDPAVSGTLHIGLVSAQRQFESTRPRRPVPQAAGNRLHHRLAAALRLPLPGRHTAGA